MLSHPHSDTAWAAAKLGVPTLLVLSHPADLGGDFVSIATDMAILPAAAGGWNYVYDRFARQTANNGLGETVARTAPPGPTVAFLRDLLANSSVEIVTGYLAVPHSGQSSVNDGHQLSVELIDRNGWWWWYDREVVAIVVLV